MARQRLVREDVMIHTDLDGGQLRCKVVLGNLYDEEIEEELLGLFGDWQTEAEVIIESNFLLPSVLEDLVQGHALYGRVELGMDAKSKPYFDALRCDLVAMLARLEGLQFKEAP